MKHRSRLIIRGILFIGVLTCIRVYAWCEPNLKQVKTADDKPVSGAYVLFSYYIPGPFNPVEPMGSIKGGSINRTDDMGMFRPTKGSYSDKYLKYVMVYAPVLHNAAGNLVWNEGGHEFDKDSGTLKLKDLSDDPKLWFQSIGFLEQIIFTSITKPYPPDAVTQAPTMIQKEFIGDYLKDAEAFRIKFKPGSPDSPEWLRQFKNMAGVSKSIEQDAQKLFDNNKK